MRRTPGTPARATPMKHIVCKRPLPCDEMLVTLQERVAGPLLQRDSPTDCAGGSGGAWVDGGGGCWPGKGGVPPVEHRCGRTISRVV
jgi:hypothetical protein